MVKCLTFYKDVPISIAITTFTRDLTPFDMVDTNVNLGRLHTHRTKPGYNNYKDSLRDEKTSYTRFYRQGIDKPHFLRSAMIVKVGYRVKQVLNIGVYQPHLFYSCTHLHLQIVS